MYFSFCANIGWWVKSDIKLYVIILWPTLELQSLVEPCASEECFVKSHEVLKSVVANEEEATCFGEDNSIPEVPNENRQPHQVLNICAPLNR